MIVYWPAAFFLLIPLLVLLFLRPLPTRVLNTIRVLLYAMLTAAAAGLSVSVPDRAGTLVVLADQSLSMPGNAKEQTESVIRRLERSRPSDSRLGVLSFGGDVSYEKLPDSPGFDGLKSILSNPHASDIASAVESALQMIPEDSPGRILLISDGAWTVRNPNTAFAKAYARGICVDIRRLARDQIHDLSICGVEAPLRVSPGESYTVRCLIDSPDDQTIECRIRRNSGAWKSRRMKVKRGLNQASWRDVSEKSGVADYEIEVVAGPDSLTDECPENNRARRLVTVEGVKPILLLTNSPSKNLAKLLRGAGLNVNVRAPSPQEVSPERLAGVSGVILENVKASSLGSRGTALIAELVKSGSLGLMMTGGRSSYAVGGYYKSPIEEILPVSLEQKSELKRTDSAIVVVLDRSGSMAMSVGNTTKIALANLATVEVLKLLSSRDEFSVIAVDSSPHIIVPLTKVSELQNAEAKIRKIESMGGGIFTYTGLKSAMDQLAHSKASARHVILFADAADAEEPGDYRNLLKKNTANGITVSVVGLGSILDPDSIFLRDVARCGNGICYFTEQAHELPRIFAEDTFVMARSTFSTDPVRAKFTRASQTLPDAAAFNHDLTFGGMNLCFPKASSEVLLVSDDGEDNPVAVLGHAGLGRVSAFCAEVDGVYTGPFANDPAAGPLLGNLASWMAVPEQGGEDFLILQSVRGGRHRIEMELDPNRVRDPFQTPPVVHTVVSESGQPPETRQQSLRWEGPDLLVCEYPLAGDATYFSALHWDAMRPIPLASVALPYSPEFLNTRMASAVTKSDIRAVGGLERITVEDIWNDLPKRPRRFSLTPLLALGCVVLLLMEVAERRFHVFRILPGRKNVDGTAESGVQQEKNPGASGREASERSRGVWQKREPARQNAPPPVSDSEPASAPESRPASQEEADSGEDELSDALRRVRRKR